MPIESKKQSKAKQDWMKENSKVYGVRVMKNTEKDLWDYLQGKEVAKIFNFSFAFWHYGVTQKVSGSVENFRERHRTE